MQGQRRFWIGDAGAQKNGIILIQEVLNESLDDQPGIHLYTSAQTNILVRGIAPVRSESRPEFGIAAGAIFAALAQEERRLISERTRNALAEAKKRGVQLGKNGMMLAERNRKAADERAEALRPIIMPMINQGLSFSEIARRLNEMGVLSVRGGRFFPEQVSLVIRRLQPK